MRTPVFALVLSALACGAFCDASTIVFQDLGEAVSVTVDGQLVKGDSGRVTNFTSSGEMISFSISADGNSFGTIAAFTNLIEPPGGDQPAGTVSDRFVESFTDGGATYDVAFGSNPDLPAVPGAAVDLTTVPEQALPANPYFENGQLQKVSTVFSAPGVALDTFFVQSDVDSVTGVPEPASVLLIATGLMFAGVRRRK